MNIRNPNNYGQIIIHDTLSKYFNQHLSELNMPNQFHYQMINDDEIIVLTERSGNKVFLLHLYSGSVNVTAYSNSDNHLLELKLFLQKRLQIGNSI